MTSAPPEPARLAEVWWPSAGEFCSGYRISDRLVLTVDHQGAAAAERPDEVQVRFLGSREEWLTGHALWRGAFRTGPDNATDIVLAEVTGAAPAAGAPVRWGQPRTGHRFGFLGAGFAAAEASGNGRRDTKEIRGQIETLTGIKGGAYALHVRGSAVPRIAVPGSSLWAGSSGSAIFSGDWLVAVLLLDRQDSYDSDLLLGCPVGLLLAHPDARSVLREAGVDHDLTELASGSDGVTRSAGSLHEWWFEVQHEDDLTPLTASSSEGQASLRSGFLHLKSVLIRNYTRNADKAAQAWARSVRFQPAQVVGQMLTGHPASERHAVVSFLRALAAHEPVVCRLELRAAFRKQPRDVVSLCASADIPFPPAPVLAHLLATLGEQR
ncbi:hypothetical protein ACFUJR_02385 [Streptomyces sp. NPDC057271]|uniref:hypothetical protein n=1 Tax=unclassified Streptomyces TaxID=2593676 RepID=UPI00363567E1